MPAPLPKAKRDAIIADIRAGGTCRGIARKHKVSPGTVNRISRSEQLTGAFERTQTKNATAARQIDLKAQRTATMARLLTIANEQLDRIGEPGLVYAFGGKDNDYNEHTLTLPPPSDVRNLMTAAAIAIDKHVVLDRHDTDSGSAEAIGVLGRFMDGLQQAARQITNQEGGA